MQEVQQMVGVLAGGVEANQEVDATVATHDLFEALAELIVAAARLGERQLACGGLEIGAQEGGVMAIARGVDPDANEGGLGRNCRRG
jgi:hypothetical protein